MRRTRIGAMTAVIAVTVAAAASGAAQAQERRTADETPYSASTSVGVHNAYEKGKYPYFADALDSGASLLELDVWTNGTSRNWRVSHSNPIGNDNNCENAASAAELRTKARNQSLGGCFADIRAWHDARPGHAPVLLKVEMKDGFNDRNGLGPDEFDALAGDRLGDALLRPADVMGGHATLDEAVTADGWPSRSELAGKFLIELIPGTVEESNPFDTLWTDREYGDRLRALAAAGRIGEAASFPAVHRAEAGDPRTGRYQDAAIRPWFVLFDGDAAAYTAGSIDTAWYDERHYLLIMTDAHNAAPAIDATHPTEAQARDRVTALAARHASFATSDWCPLPQVLSMVVPRG